MEAVDEGGGETVPVASSPVSSGMAATANSPAARATALFTPDATPAWRTSAAASTVAVSGATVTARPMPNRTRAGSTVV